MALNIGDSAPEFMLINVDGNLIGLQDFEDADVLAVIFSCNHCPYVLAWEDRMIAIQKDYADKGVQLVLINSNNAEKYPADSFDAMQAHSEKKAYPFPYLYDESQETAHEYGGERTPHVFLFDTERKLVYKGAIDDSYDDPNIVTQNYLRDAIDATLAHKKPKIPVTDSVGCTIKWK